jgi:hypothetical protein
MTSRAYLIAAAVALAFSGTALAQSSTGKSESAPTKSTTISAADCASLSGDRKEQCMRHAQQSSKSGTATGATPGGAAGGTSGAAPKAQSAPGGSAPAKPN